MAWRSSGRTNQELIDKMRANGLISSAAVAEAMQKVDRANYVPKTGAAYQDSPQTIGFSATISAPHMHAHACEYLLESVRAANTSGGAILDVGSGSGYLTAVLHRLAPRATVVGIDHIQGLVDMSLENLAKDGVSVSAGGPRSGADVGEETQGRVVMVCGDGRKGAPAFAPFHAIHVGAAAPTMPQPLIDQLASPGRLFIPVGDLSQDVWQVDKDEDGKVTQTKLFGVMYVPLTDADKQWRQ